MARPNKTPKQNRSDAPGSRKDEDADESQTSPVSMGEADDIGYKPTRRQVARGDKTEPRGAEESTPKKPKTPYEEFMEQHWEGWLRPVLLILLAGAGVLAYRNDMLSEWKIGLVLAGGLIAVAIYAVAAPAYDLIQNSTARALFGLLVVLWAISSGYPAVRKAVPRKVLAEAVITEGQKSAKVNVQPVDGKNGPYDVTISASLKQSGQDSSINYSLNVAGDNGQTAEIQGEFQSKVTQVRGRRGTSHWTEQHNQVEHRLPSSIVGKELTFSTEDSLNEQLESGIHVAVHPQGLDVSFMWIVGVLVVLCMFFVETRIGDAGTKPHLVMISAATLIFSQLFIHSATSTRMVKPIVEAVFLAALGGGIGGTTLGWMARRIGKRDTIKPKKEKDKEEDKADRRADAEVGA